MKEPRRIVLILGNGFDIDLNLETKYENFWKSTFCPKDYPAPLIKHLNERWPGDNEKEKVKWYDLENELIAYYEKIKVRSRGYDVISPAEASLIQNRSLKYLRSGRYDYKDIDLLQVLLKKGIIVQSNDDKFPYDLPYYEDLRQSAVFRDKKAFLLIKKGLCDYLNSLDYNKANNNSIASAVYYTIAQRIDDSDIVSIYTFNYTHYPIDGDSRYDGITHHVHGDCKNGRIIVGTRDNEELSEDYDFLQKSFDPNFFPPPIVPDLQDATDVIIFGHSIGENDRQYFGSFFKQQTSNNRPKRVNITIFTRDDNSELEIKRALQKMTDSNLSVLCSQNNLMIIKTGCLKDNHDDYFEFLSEYISDQQQCRMTKGEFLKTISKSE